MINNPQEWDMLNPKKDTRLKRELVALICDYVPYEIHITAPKDVDSLQELCSVNNLTITVCKTFPCMWENILHVLHHFHRLTTLTLINPRINHAQIDGEFFLKLERVEFVSFDYITLKNIMSKLILNCTTIIINNTYLTNIHFLHRQEIQKLALKNIKEVRGIKMMGRLNVPEIVIENCFIQHMNSRKGQTLTTKYCEFSVDVRLVTPPSILNVIGGNKHDVNRFLQNNVVGRDKKIQSIVLTNDLMVDKDFSWTENYNSQKQGGLTVFLHSTSHVHRQRHCLH
jgi:hypothetical protein